MYTVYTYCFILYIIYITECKQRRFYPGYRLLINHYRVPIKVKYGKKS